MRSARVTLVAALALAACAPQAPPREPTASTTSTPSTTPISTTTDTNTSGGNQSLRAAGWVSIAIGASSAIVALGTSGIMLHQQSVRSSNCDAQKICNADGIAANNNLSSIAPWNAAAWALAAAGTGAGIFLVLTNPPRSSPVPPGQTALGVGPTGSGTGVTLRGSF